MKIPEVKHDGNLKKRTDVAHGDEDEEAELDHLDPDEAWPEAGGCDGPVNVCDGEDDDESLVTGSVPDMDISRDHPSTRRFRVDKHF